MNDNNEIKTNEIAEDQNDSVGPPPIKLLIRKPNSMPDSPQQSDGSDQLNLSKDGNKKKKSKKKKKKKNSKKNCMEDENKNKQDINTRFEKNIVHDQSKASKTIDSFDEVTTTVNVTSDQDVKQKRRDLTKEEEEDEQNANWSVGDLAWGKVVGHPWWPCMVSYDPYLQVYVRRKVTNKALSTFTYIYHVQYFGLERERGWLSNSSMQPFMGPNIEEFKQTLLKSVGGKRKSEINKGFDLKSKHLRISWDLAISEAEQARTNPVNERDIFVYQYPTAEEALKLANEENKKKQIERKRKRSPTNSAKRPSTINSNSGNISKKPKLDLSDENYRCLVFFKAKHKEVRDEYPDKDESFIQAILEEKWKDLPLEEQLKFTPSSEDEELLKLFRSHLEKSNSVNEKIENLNLNSSLKDDIESNDKEVETGKRRKRKIKRKYDIKELYDSGTDSFEDKKFVISTDVVQQIFSEESLEIFNLSAMPYCRKEKICFKCENGNNVNESQIIVCSTCQSSFHQNCIEWNEQSLKIICGDCHTGMHECFNCKKKDETTMKCEKVTCNRFYHKECIKKIMDIEVSNEQFICSLHTCKSCLNTGKKECSKGRLYKCIRCPTAYHISEFCIEAGSVHLPGYNIICGNHFIAKKSKSHHMKIHVNVCLNCPKDTKQVSDTTLVCCDNCPLAFHKICIETEVKDNEPWLCIDCKSGKVPKYGDLVWVKVGQYRWWPSEICHVRNVPQKIQNMEHGIGEFVVRFFGSYDYFWTHKARVYAFHEDDVFSKTYGSSSKSVAVSFQKAMIDIKKAFSKWKEFKNKLDEQSFKKKTPYRYIKTNIYIGKKIQENFNVNDITRCTCTFSDPCSLNSQCWNRLANMECLETTCSVGKDNCRNRLFQNRTWVNASPFLTEDNRGWGLKTNIPIKNGNFVIEYVGEVIDNEECKLRLNMYAESNTKHYYIINLSKNRFIDSGQRGNLARFINHSCNPNCISQVWKVDNNSRVGLFATRDIDVGEELTFNYNLYDYDNQLGDEKKACYCGSANCKGVLNVDPKQLKDTMATNVSIKKKRKKRSSTNRKFNLTSVKHDDNCFYCNEGGNLIMCDQPRCTKCYHKECIAETTVPRCKWLCPWHFCDICGKEAVDKCCLCPSSFCLQDADSNIIHVPDLDNNCTRIVCTKHDDVIGPILLASEDSSTTDSSTTEQTTFSNFVQTLSPVKEIIASPDKPAVRKKRVSRLEKKRKSLIQHIGQTKNKKLRKKKPSLANIANEDGNSDDSFPGKLVIAE